MHNELLFALLFYIYGSIPFALIFTYIAKREILYEKDPGPIGVASAFMVGGLPAGFLTVIGETSKIALPLIVSAFYFDGSLTASLVFISSALIGTNFSVFLKGKGGMGSTIVMWTLLILCGYFVFLFGAMWLVLFRVTRDSSFSSMITYFSLPVLLFLIGESVPFAVFGLLAAVLFCFKYYRSKGDSARYTVETVWLKKAHIIDVANAKGDSEVGSKARKLNFLKRKGFKIPETYACSSTAYEKYTSGNKHVLKELRQELGALISEGKTYSLCSSTNLPDETNCSPFESYANVNGIEEIVEGIEGIWSSSRGDKATAYLNRIGKSSQELEMGVIIQEKITPKLSGVVFTRNPISGMDEVIVESVPGFGRPLERARITPDRWVCKWGEWLEKPEDREYDLPIAQELVTEAKEIARKYGKPLNLEWVHNGEDIHWLQLREIAKPKGVNIYSNKISKGFMPGIVKPLIWSVNIAVVNSSWKRLFTEIVGKAAEDIDINNLAKSFYYRAYFNMGVIGDIFELLGLPRESIELVMGYEVVGSDRPKFKPSFKTFRYLPRMIFFAIDKSMYSGKIERFLADQREKYDHFHSMDIEKLDEKETLDLIHELFEANEETSYLVIITQLLMGFYNNMLKRQLEKIGVDIGKVDSTEVAEKYRDIDPNHFLSILHDKYEELTPDLKHRMKEMSYEDFLGFLAKNDFEKEIEKFLLKFGYLSDSGNDFSQTQWRENPDLILKMIMNYRQPMVQQSDKVEINTLFGNRIKDMFLAYMHRNAAKYREYKERMSFLYTYGYGLFRPFFLHLAKLFKGRDFIDEEQDIFYLTLDEIENVVKSGGIPGEYQYNLEKGKREVMKYRDIFLPDLIIGDILPVPLTKDGVFDRLKGIAASRGYCQGRVKVVRGIRDFDKVEDGDIIAIPYSDVSWNPLFAKAKAVISESGGMLSHSAVVAREYNLPAVVSVKGATELKDNTLVAVDGYKGEILVIE